MRVEANGRPREVAAGATIADLVRDLGLDPRYVVVERNGEIVPRTDADAVELEEGDRLVLVRAVAGGAEGRSPEHARRPPIAGGAEVRSGDGGFPSMSAAGARRMARLEDARLYVVTDARRDRGDLEAFLTAVCEASVDIVQLRDKTATEDDLRAAADVFRRVCERTGALFIVNDLPGLAVQVGADGVHVGQDDVHPDHARRVVGPDLIVGRSTHGPDQLDRAADEDVDYVAVGPVHATPTKAGRPAIGIEPIRYAARSSAHPWFAIGGLDAETLPEVLEAGARRVAVVRFVCDADDAADACWTLRKAVGAYHL